MGMLDMRGRLHAQNRNLSGPAEIDLTLTKALDRKLDTPPFQRLLVAVLFTPDVGVAGGICGRAPSWLGPQIPGPWQANPTLSTTGP